MTTTLELGTYRRGTFIIFDENRMRNLDSCLAASDDQEEESEVLIVNYYTYCITCGKLVVMNQQLLARRGGINMPEFRTFL